LPLWAQVTFAILVADFGITIAHWMSHRVPALWKLHEVHHSVKRMYGFNGLMKHPVHLAVEGVFGLLPLLLIGIPFNVAAVLAYAIAIELLLQHSNFDMKLGPLRHVFAWAPTHQFHHMRYGTSGDVNFALFFSGWDRLLGTTFHTHGHRISSKDLGIGTRPNYPDPYLAQLREPFVSAIDHAPVPETPASLKVPGSF
jgi:sterol desaturase/sphingolipid hydroxylase (fatty acid hydroxylase superfamily)